MFARAMIRRVLMLVALLGVAAPGRGDEAPSWWDATPRVAVDADARIEDRGAVVVMGQVSISEAEAEKSARARLDRAVALWLAPDIRPGWTPPAEVVSGLVRGHHHAAELNPLADQPAFEGYRTLVTTGLLVDFSAERRAELLELHTRDVVAGRLRLVGAGLAFALVGLATLAGYIRADESTRGYFTGRLRLVAAAAVGAAGAAAYFLS